MHRTAPEAYYSDLFRHNRTCLAPDIFPECSIGLKLCVVEKLIHGRLMRKLWMILTIIHDVDRHVQLKSWHPASVAHRSLDIIEIPDCGFGVLVFRRIND